MIIIVMGVAGAGKTTIGTRLAAELECEYLEGDALHAPASVAKMESGIPLTDADRRPWLRAIRKRMLEADAAGIDLVVGCSALRAAYRLYLAEGLAPVWVYLSGSADVIQARLRERKDHFMPVELLADQIQTLEPPRDAIEVDVSAPVPDIIETILKQLPLP